MPDAQKKINVEKKNNGFENYRSYQGLKTNTVFKWRNTILELLNCAKNVKLLALLQKCGEYQEIIFGRKSYLQIREKGKKKVFVQPPDDNFIPTPKIVYNH